MCIRQPHSAALRVRVAHCHRGARIAQHTARSGGGSLARATSLKYRGGERAPAVSNPTDPNPTDPTSPSNLAASRVSYQRGSYPEHVTQNLVVIAQYM